MIGWLRRYTRWLHTGWPAGTVERLPEVRPDGGTIVPGVFVAGDLTGIPLLKFALDSGARVVRRIAAEPEFAAGASRDGTDLAILGAGVSGMAAALEARRLGLTACVVEAAEPFATLINFPRAKPIYTYPHAMVPAGALQVRATVKEALVAELRAQVEPAPPDVRADRAVRIEPAAGRLRVHLESGAVIEARRVLIAIGRSGDFRMLGVPGETLDKVTNRLHDPNDFAGQDALVVGGGDSAVETAIALAGAGARVTLAHRNAELTRPKPELIVRLRPLLVDGSAPAPRAGRVAMRPSTRVTAIAPDEVTLADASERQTVVRNNVVFTMIGRQAPLDFFRRSGLPIAGEMTPRRWVAFGAFLVFCAALYNWKAGGVLSDLWYRRQWYPTNLPALLGAAGGAIAAAAQNPATLIGTLAISAASPSFYYTLAYSLVVVIFGFKRMRRRRTPYVRLQTTVLMLVQVLPLFLLPEIILPLLHHRHALPVGLEDALFPVANYGHGREFWRAYGLILAWPLNVYNIFTAQPLWWWIGIGFVQTCVLIPLLVLRYGKGAYCGWICSCGALAETLGDAQRHKMPHGPGWNRLNMLGQGVLAIAVALLLLRIAGWALPRGNWIDRNFYGVFGEHYKWWVDVFLGGVVGYGAYFWYSGRVWCRFACPLAAWMHIVARFSRFRIFADKKKCISCGQCTAQCHQGIDVMSFANRGLPMADPQCVRCSACVEVCPTGVLSFGRLGANGLITFDHLAASPVQMREEHAPTTARAR